MQKTLFGISKQTNDRALLAEYLYQTFQTIDLKDFARLITNEFDETIEYYRLMQGEKACQKTSLLFNPHRLNTRTNNSNKSIFEAIKDRKFCDGLARALLFKKDKVKELLYQTIQLGVNGTQYVNEMPPRVLIDLHKQFGGNKILDPCAGWGGRMIGASVVCESYTAFEPASATYRGLIQLDRFLRQFKPNFRSNIYMCPFEDAKIPEQYDLAFTSPPYYDTEHYSTEYDNSFNRYGSYEEWVKNFFLVLINKTMSSVKKDGAFILNIGNRQYPLDKELMTLNDTYSISPMSSLLSGKGGLGRASSGELFFIIKHKE